MAGSGREWEQCEPPHCCCVRRGLQWLVVACGDEGIGIAEELEEGRTGWEREPFGLKLGDGGCVGECAVAEELEETEGLGEFDCGDERGV